MQKKRPTTQDDFYRSGALGGIKRWLDTVSIRLLPEKRSISGRLATVDRAYAKQRIDQDRQYGRKAPCPLCEDINDRYVMFSTQTMHVVANDFPYYLFDGLQVKRHFMLLPKRHTNSFGDFSEQEQTEYWKLLVKMTDMGCIEMTRPPGNERRSVPSHLHTHIIEY